jgi:hypothetical protein
MARYGLSAEDVAGLLGVSARQVGSWRVGQKNVIPGIWLGMLEEKLRAYKVVSATPAQDRLSRLRRVMEAKGWSCEAVAATLGRESATVKGWLRSPLKTITERDLRVLEGLPRFDKNLRAEVGGEKPL